MLCLNLIIPNITPGGLFSGGGGLYMEGVFHFKSWFLNAPGLIYGGAYYQNFMVYIQPLCGCFGFYNYMFCTHEFHIH